MRGVGEEGRGWAQLAVLNGVWENPVKYLNEDNIVSTLGG